MYEGAAPGDRLSPGCAVRQQGRSAPSDASNRAAVPPTASAFASRLGFCDSPSRGGVIHEGAAPADRAFADSPFRGRESKRSPTKKAQKSPMKRRYKGRALPLSDKFRSACLDSRFRPATRPLRRVKPNDRLPPPENPQAAPLICRLPLKGGVMVERGRTGGPGVLPGALSTPQRSACPPIRARRRFKTPLMSLICPGKGACYAIIRRLRQESDGRFLGRRFRHSRAHCGARRRHPPPLSAR